MLHLFQWLQSRRRLEFGNMRAHYYPICLITHILIGWRCCQCKAPFHERLYELFGLCPYMPPSWEHNPKHTPEMPSKWGEDLVWNWRMDAHSLNKSVFSFAMGWENDHEEIVRVANSIIKGSSQQARGMCNFFYQCFKGYWDLANGRFQFRVHPQGFIWNDNGRIVGNHSTASLHICNDVNIAKSNWTTIFQERVVDFLLEQHSPQTMKVLHKMESFQYMRDALELDGPTRRTRAAIK